MELHINKCSHSTNHYTQSMFQCFVETLKGTKWEHWSTIHTYLVYKIFVQCNTRTLKYYNIKYTIYWVWEISEVDTQYVYAMKLVLPKDLGCIVQPNTWHLFIESIGTEHENINTWHYSLTNMWHALITSMHQFS